MDNDMKYCRNCGKLISKNANFCRFCGYNFTAQKTVGSPATQPASMAPPAQKSANTGTSSQKPVFAGNVNGKPVYTEAPAAKPASRRNSGNKSSSKGNTGKGASSSGRTGKRKSSKKGFGGIVVLVLLAFAVTGFIFPGFLLKPDGPKPGGKKIEYSKTNETETLSLEKLETRLSDSGVSIALTEWILDPGQEEKLTVKSKEPVYAENGDYVIKPYSVTLGDIHEMDDFIEIRIPYDKTFCEKGENPAECVGGVYYNRDTGEWEETLYDIDKKRGEVVIYTDHFSDFGAMTVKNKGTRDAFLSGGSSGSIYGDEDLTYLTEDQAISTMKVMCQNNAADSPTARLAGTQVMQAAMALGDATSTAVDVGSATFSIAYILDLTDNAMTGNYFNYHGDTNYFNYVPGPYADPSVTYTNRSFNIYNNDLVKKSGDVLSNVGTIVSACKVGYLAGKAAAGKAEDSEIFQLYKECASMAVTLSGSVTLSALMGPVMLADTFINYMFTEAFAIKESQVQEMYVWFNEKYPGTGAPYYTRKGRSAADWRKQIIKLIKEKPYEDTADLLEFEVNEFCNEFWELDFDEMGDVVAQCPKNIKRVTDTDRKMRDKITEAYKKQLYDLLNRAVMPSVREYFNKQMIKEAQKSIARAKKYYNQVIEFDIYEAEHTDKNGNKGTKADNIYAGYKTCFTPLSRDADIDSWSSTIPKKNVGQHGEFTLIGHITSGKPEYLAVYEPDANILTDVPVAVAPVIIEKVNGKQHAQITIEEKEAEDISQFNGTWYDQYGDRIEVATYMDGTISFFNLGDAEDTIFGKYEVLPKDAKIKVYGQDFKGDPEDTMIEILNPTCDKYDLGSNVKFYAGTDKSSTYLVLFFNGGMDAYRREPPETQTIQFDYGNTNVPPPPDWDGVSDYDLNWQVIPPGD